MKDEVERVIPFLEDAIVATNWRTSARWLPMITFLRTKLSDDLLRTYSDDIFDFLQSKTGDYVQCYNFDEVVLHLDRTPAPGAHFLPPTHPSTLVQSQTPFHQPLRVGEDACSREEQFINAPPSDSASNIQGSSRTQVSFKVSPKPDPPCYQSAITLRRDLASESGHTRHLTGKL